MNENVGQECPHPKRARETMHGFGQRPGDVSKFWCKVCQRIIEPTAENKSAFEALFTEGAK